MAGARAGGRWRSILFDLTVAGFVACLSMLPAVGTSRLAGPGLIGLCMAAALVWRRRYPLGVMAVVSALALAQVVRFPPIDDPMPYDIAVLIAMYSVVKYGRRLWYGFLAAVPVGIGVVIEVARHIDQTEAARSPIRVWSESVAFLALACAAVWLVGYTLRTRRLYVVSLEDRAATAERERDHLARIAVGEERATIARELHDIVAHSMAVMIVQADGASYALDGDPEQARVAIKQVASTGREALDDMRRLVEVLRGATPPTEELDAADRRRIGLDQLPALVERARSAGLTVTLNEHGSRERVPAAVELTVYRIAQEALTNVLRHGGPPTAVTLALTYEPDAVEIEVVDDGSGRLTSAIPSQTAGHGLIGMRERVAIHNGTFTAGPRLGGGWRVQARVPWT